MSGATTTEMIVAMELQITGEWGGDKGARRMNSRLKDLAMMLRQFGRLQIGRLVGTVSNQDGRYKAWIDLLERGYFMRAEINARTKILIDKKLLTVEELTRHMEEEYEHLAGELAKDWPEAKVTPTGITMDADAMARRSKEERWPP